MLCVDPTRGIQEMAREDMAIDKRSDEEQTASGLKGGLGDTTRIIVHALILAVLIRIFLFQPFNIPSGSMKGTLLIGDYLFVSKYAYGYSHHSLPWSPKLFSGRIWSATPERGDVAVFKNPVTKEDYIKRVIGLPGDEIQMRGGILHINGKAIPKRRIADFTDRSPGYVRVIPRYEETLPNGVRYQVLDQVSQGAWDDTSVYVVPAGHYFMMGDNRDNSTDSRVFRHRHTGREYAVGPVPLENFVGRADRLFFSTREGSSYIMFWRWPFDIRWSRLFRAVE